METSNKYFGRDYISTSDWSKEDLIEVLEVSSKLKEMRHKGIPHRHLLGQTVFLMFFDKSTRTRNSFEAGATQLGAHAHFIDIATSQIAHGETAKDTGIILSSYGEAIAIRHDLIPGEGNSYIREVAKYADVPVFNMQCDIDHPFQTTADLMTIREEFGKDLQGLKIAVSWAYTKSYAKPLSVPQGLITLLTRFGCEVTLAHPPEFKLMKNTLKEAEENARKSGGKFAITDSMEDAFEGADVVYPKSWGIEELFSKPEEALALAEKYKGWICDSDKMKLTNDNSIYMHCLPADRGKEVSDEVIDGSHSRVFQEAENRLHTSKAVMLMTMAKKLPNLKL